MLKWARHLASRDPRFHRVDAVIPGGSVLLRCKGRWPERDAVEERYSPPFEERCGACSGDDMQARFDVGGDV